MASIMPITSTPGGVRARSEATSSGDGVQVRQMNLKVHYTFDKDNQVHCLARWPHPLHVQTVCVDERKTIGIVDLGVCLQAVSQCSPELLNQLEVDYTVYAHDYSEPYTPLVGQGMLSWILGSTKLDVASRPSSQLVTGLVTKNVLSLFTGGAKETIEVKLKFTPVSKFGGIDCTPVLDCQFDTPVTDAPNPLGAIEWAAFLEKNPQLGLTESLGHMPSAALIPAVTEPERPVSQSTQTPTVQDTEEHTGLRRPVPIQPMPQLVAPEACAKPVNPNSDAAPKPAEARRAPSRPSSRASRSAKPANPTGRPRGRPRKHPVVEGNTSGYEDGTDGDDGPMRKRRAIVTAVAADTMGGAPFVTDPESLRVAASTSASLRSLRPIASGNGAVNPIRDLPRAPTPIPKRGQVAGRPKIKILPKPQKPPSLAQVTSPAAQQPFFDSGLPISPSIQDGRRLDLTPNYPEDSPADLNSSPLLVRENAFMRSSPPPSSPIFSPIQRQDSAFAGLETDDPGPDSQAGHRLPGWTNKDKPSVPVHVFREDNMELLKSYNAEAPIRDVSSAPSLFSHKSSHISGSRPGIESSVSGPTSYTTAPISHPVLSINSDGQATLSGLPSCDAMMPRDSTNQRGQTDPVGEQGQARRRTSVQSTTVEALSPVLSHSAKEANPATAQREESVKRALSLPDIAIAGGSGQAVKKPSPLVRSNSVGPLALPQIPASDPDGPRVSLALPAVDSFSEAVCPPSDVEPVPPSSPPLRFNKNQVKKLTIKQRLEQAVENGECPPFCNNCGAVQTPTWRKIWSQTHSGVPEFVECSDRPGCVTAIAITERNADKVPTAYRLTKKYLGSEDIKADWEEALLCNPCGIWLSKFKQYRPPDRWEKDQSRLGQDRPKRSGISNAVPRSRKGRANGAASENNVMMDSAGPLDGQESPRAPGSPLQASAFEDTRPAGPQTGLSQSALAPCPQLAIGRGERTETAPSQAPATVTNTGSTHSRASRGTAHSPIQIEDEDFGSVRRQLFPAFRKDGALRQLGAVAVNVIVQPIHEAERYKPSGMGKENYIGASATADELHYVDIDALFQSPLPRRPTTPTRIDGLLEPFKTPTKSTPSHRPVTRSISRSIRSERLFTPTRIALSLQSPSKTPSTIRSRKMWAAPAGSSSPLLRRSPRNRLGSAEGALQQISHNIKLAASLRSSSSSVHLRPSRTDQRGSGLQTVRPAGPNYDCPNGQAPRNTITAMDKTQENNDENDDNGLTEGVRRSRGGDVIAFDPLRHQSHDDDDSDQAALCGDSLFMHSHFFDQLPDLASTVADQVIRPDEYDFGFLSGAGGGSDGAPLMDLTAFLSTDAVFPSSPPKGLYDPDEAQMAWAGWTAGQLHAAEATDDQDDKDVGA